MAGTGASPPVRRTTSSSSSSTRSARTCTCCFSSATLTTRRAARACRKKVPLAGLAHGAGDEPLGRVEEEDLAGHALDPIRGAAAAPPPATERWGAPR